MPPSTTEQGSTSLSVSEVVAAHIAHAKIMSLQQAQIDRLKIKYRNLKVAFQAQVRGTSLQEHTSPVTDVAPEVVSERIRDPADEDLELRLAACQEIITHQELQIKNAEKRADSAEHWLQYWVKEAIRLEGAVEPEELPSVNTEVDAKNVQDKESDREDATDMGDGDLQPTYLEDLMNDRRCAFHKQQWMNRIMGTEHIVDKHGHASSQSPKLKHHECPLHHHE